MKEEIDLFAQLKIDRDKLHTSTLATQEYVNVPKHSSGMTPMDQVSIDGAAGRGMVSGRMPWWVMITGWFGVGLYAAIVVAVAFEHSSLQSLLLNPGFWIPSFILVMFIMILWRGTARKLASRKPKKIGGKS
jgi:hypothetical protein